MSEAVDIPFAEGPVPALWDGAPDASRGAVVMVGGADGGFDGPAEALYLTLAEDLLAADVSSLRVDFRVHKFPNDVEARTPEVEAALDWLREQGVSRAVLVGHSFGGAVVIEAGVRSRLVVGLVTLATQTAGALRVGELAPRPILLVHGAGDTRLSPRCSEMLYEMAGEPRRVVILDGATHSLRQAREQVRTLVREFALEVLDTR